MECHGDEPHTKNDESVPDSYLSGYKIAGKEVDERSSEENGED